MVVIPKVTGKQIVDEKLKTLYLSARKTDADRFLQETGDFLHIIHAASRRALEKNLKTDSPDVVFLDVDVPNQYFPETMRKIRTLRKNIPVYVLTRETDFFFQLPPNAPPPDAVFPFPPERDVIREKLAAVQKRNQDGSGADAPAAEDFSVPGCYPEGISPAAVKLRRELRQAAETDFNVLLLGETGCGKERAAGAIHFHSARKQHPFRAQNVSTLPESIIDSLLFGTTKGCYTGAGDREGLFEQCAGGTLFLDEIGEMDVRLQPKLLRVLEEREVYRLGAKTPVKTDFRLICATNRDLQESVHCRTFRADLLYRLDILRIEIPPLRERPEDIPAFLSGLLKKTGKTVSLDALDKLSEYDWPGNIRQLQNCVARAACKTQEEEISADAIVF